MWRQAKKVRGVQTAFRLFNRIMRVPGKGELTMVELRVRVIFALSAPLCCTWTCLQSRRNGFDPQFATAS